MATANIPSQAVLDHIRSLYFIGKDGVVTRRFGRKRYVKPRKDGYIKIGFWLDQVNYTFYAHRIAYYFFYGEWPMLELDHIDGDKSNNRASNLRMATRAQNLANRGKQANNKSGYKGVSYSRQNKAWKATFIYDKKVFQLGFYTSPEQAADAYNNKALEVLGTFVHKSCVDSKLI
jgi:hypothetical protein